MRIRITTFDPSMLTANGGVITNLLPNDTGTLLIYNDSMTNIVITYGNYSHTILAGLIDIIPLCEPSHRLTVMKDTYQPNNSGQAPTSTTVVDGYSSDETVPGNYPMPIPRVSNVGNTIPVNQSVSTVVNDGNAAPTLVVEATPSGASGSQLKWNNDGSGTFGGGNIIVSAAGIFTTIPNNAIPPAAINGAVPYTTGFTDSAATYKAPIGVDIPDALLIVNNQSTSAFGYVWKVWDGTTQRSGFTLNKDGTVNFAQNNITFSNTGNITTNGTLNVTSGLFTGYAGLFTQAALNNANIAPLELSRTGTNGTGDWQFQIDSSGTITLNDMKNSASSGWYHDGAQGVLAWSGNVAGRINNVTTTLATSDWYGFPVYNNGSAIRNGCTFSGSGSGTFSHGLSSINNFGGLAPSWIGITENVANSTMTVGIDSLGSSTVHVNTGVSAAWLGHAHRM